MLKNKLAIAAFTVVLILSALIFCPVSAQQGNAQAAIDQARTAVNNSYNAVKQAEAAGANVTALVSTLNRAAGLLSQAELAYASRDFASAYNYAVQSQNMLNVFNEQAVALQENAAQIQRQNFVAIIFSAVISVAILFVGVGLWFTLNRQEKRNVSGHQTV